MNTETTTTFTSPFESGEWARWRNVDRRNWLRKFRDELKANEKQITPNFKLDKKKIKRLDEALKILEAKLQEELAISEKGLEYSQAMLDLGMDAMLMIDIPVPISLPAFNTPKRSNKGGN